MRHSRRGPNNNHTRSVTHLSKIMNIGIYLHEIAVFFLYHLINVNTNK